MPLPGSDVISFVNTIQFTTLVGMGLFTKNGIRVVAKLNKSAIVDGYIHCHRRCYSNPPGWEIAILKDTNQLAHLVPLDSVGEMLGKNVCTHLVGFAVRNTKLTFTKSFV